jgi:hypothetical protein
MMLPSAMIAVRGKSLGKQHRRDAQRAQDQLRKNNNAVLGNIKRSELFYVAGLPDEDSCIRRLRLRTATLSECIVANLGGQCPLWVKSGHRVGSRSCPLYPQKRTLVQRSVMSAGRQKPARMMSDYSMLVFALNLIDVWLPSQNGLFFEAPQRQTVMRLRISYW